MSRFIETIRAEYGCVQLMDSHQERVNNTLKHFHSTVRINLTKEIQSFPIPFIPTCRIRVEYALDGIKGIEFFSYEIKEIDSIGIMEIGFRDYRFKYADREWIKKLVNASGCDEIIMVNDKTIRDASIANLAFFNGNDWVTPNTPLLAGTMRQRLIEQGVIHEASISISKLRSYEKIKLINAMLPWEKSPEISADLIRSIVS